MQEFVQDIAEIDLNVVDKTFRTNVWAAFAFTK